MFRTPLVRRAAGAALLLAPLALACRSAGGAAAPDAPADLVVYGRVWTGDSTRPWAQAVAVRGERIAAVGDSAEVARLVGPATKVLANGRAMVAPGFNDGHTHFMESGLQLTRVDLRDAATPAEFVRRIKAYAATLQPGEWILGGNWDHERWAGSPLPMRQWIDSVTPDNPVFVDRLDGHMGVANSKALALAGVTRATKDVAGGTIVRDARGEPTGVLKDNAKDLVYRVVPEPSSSQADSGVARASAYAASKGVTGVSAVSMSWAELAAVKRARKDGRLTIRMSTYVPLSEWRQMAETLKANGPGDAWLRVAGLKGFVDGSLGSRTALMFQPYADDPSTRGLLVTPEDSLRRWIGAADSAGLQVAVHAIGDSANALLLAIYDSVAKAHGPRDRRFRDEHSQHVRAEDVRRFATTPVLASMQPYHAIDDGRWAVKRVGPERIHDMYRFRSMLDQHVHLAFGSDWSVAPIDPLLGIYAAVTRRTLDDKNPGGWVPEQKISLDDALRAYTAGNAYAVFAERERGVLRPGMLADLVLLDRDLSAIPPEQIRDAQVRTTIAGGRVIYQAAAATP
ncbi:MAG TPA: amidohydrolase [Gemmatimonadales bacterium]|nr:amidohydrolase [Gemmatimonadales bacterium]